MLLLELILPPLLPPLMPPPPLPLQLLLTPFLLLFRELLAPLLPAAPAGELGTLDTTEEATEGEVVPGGCCCSCMRVLMSHTGLVSTHTCVHVCVGLVLMSQCAGV